MSRRSIAYKREYEHTDFSVLMNQLQGVDMSEVPAVEVAVNGMESVIDRPRLFEESEERHRIMSNQKIKYLFSRDSSVIHDKHCACAKLIPDSVLEYSEEYLCTLNPCKECELQAYIINGAKDPKELDKYLQFFEKAMVTDVQIRNIYIENGMKTKIYPDVFTIWHKEDVWRIKLLPKKGHVQLYHNNYVVRKKGVREFTQGFHIQNQACEDTNFAFALSVIKNYEYKPEEYALHNGKVNPIERKKAKQKKAEKLDQNAVSLEALLGERTEEMSLWQRMKESIVNLFKKKSFFELNGFTLVSEQDYPKNQTICIYVWKDKNDKLSWQTGLYNQKLKQFSVRYGAVAYAIKQDKVIAWKKMDADAVALDA